MGLRTVPGAFVIPHLIRDNPDCGTYKAGYRGARKDRCYRRYCTRRNRAAKIDTYLDDDLRSSRWLRLRPVMFYYRRVINRHARSYRSTVPYGSRLAVPSSVLSEAVEKRAENGSCTCRRGQGRPPARSRRGRRSGTSWRRRGTGEAGFLTKTSAECAFRHPRDDESGKRVSIRRAELNNSDKGPSLASLTRECNLLAPARCALPAALFSSLPGPPSHAVTTPTVRSWSPCPFTSFGKRASIINSGNEREGIDPCTVSNIETRQWRVMPIIN